VSDWFAWPAASAGLLLLPALYWWSTARARTRARRLARYLGARAAALTAEVGTRRRSVQRQLWFAGLCCALLAIMQPLWGPSGPLRRSGGGDVMICLDISRSMLARDARPDRLTRAQRAIGSIAERTRGDRLGLVVFAGEARLAVPLTHDMVSFSTLVARADPSAVARGGTDLGEALQVALASLADQQRERSIILITDGEDQGERGLDAAAHCRDRNVTVHCIGVGSPRGSKIALPSGHGQTFLVDRAGDEVITAMDPEALATIAAAAGGRFTILSDDGPLPALGLRTPADLHVAPDNAHDSGAGGDNNRYQWPLLAAILLWTLELSWSARRRR